MSQPLSVITPDLLKKLQADISKYKLHGPPIFRQNIPCKYGDQCKYGRYSCIYSHESLCKYQKNNKTCLNRSKIAIFSLLKLSSDKNRNFPTIYQALIHQFQRPITILKAIQFTQTAQLYSTNFASIPKNFRTILLKITTK